METKDYKSIYIHNGCRNQKMTVVREVPKRTWKYSAIHVLKMYRGKYILYVRYLIDLNISMQDAEIQKCSLRGFKYFNSKEYAFAKLRISFNDLRISFHQQIIKKLTREK